MPGKHNVKGHYRSHVNTNDKAIWIPKHTSKNPIKKK